MKKFLLEGLFLSIAGALCAAESVNFKDSFKTPSGIETRFEFKSDSHWLFLKIWCMEPDMKNLKAVGRIHDVDVWKDDNVEIFINPARDGRIFAQFAVSPTGTMYDSKVVEMARDARWNPPNIEVKPFKGPDFWGVELKFPISVFVALLPDSEARSKVDADSWSFNIVRNRKASGRDEVATYAECAHWLDAGKYVPLKGVMADFKSMRWNVGGISLTGIMPQGDGYAGRVEVGIDNQSDKMSSVKVVAALASLQKDKKIVLAEKNVAVDKGQMFRFSQVVSIPETGAYLLEVCLSDNRGRPLGYASVPASVEYIPVRMKIVSGAYRGHDIFSTMDTTRLELELETGLEYHFDKEERCELSLSTTGDSKKIMSTEIVAAEVFSKRQSLQLPKLEPGKYLIKAQFSKRTIPTAQVELEVYPMAESEIYVNGKGNFVRNGKEFFPIGGFGAWWTWPQYEHKELIDFDVSYSPLHPLSKELEAKMTADARRGWRIACYPEPPELWSHPVADIGAKRALRPIPLGNERKISERVREYRGKDFVFGWYLVDEPSESKVLPAYLTRMNEIVNEADPYHVTIQCFNSCEAARIYGASCDVAIIDYFPGFHELGREQPLSSFVSLLKNSAKNMGGKKPIIAAPPLYAYAGSGQYPARYPTYAEQRCMSFTAMTCDEVRGFCWNDVSRIGVTPGMFLGVPAITEELRKLEKVWLSRSPADIKISGPDGARLLCIGKLVNGELYVLTVNPHDVKLSVKLSLPKEFKTVRELAAGNDRVDVENGSVKLEYLPLQVRIFSSDPNAPSLPSFESVSEKIKAFDDNEVKSGNLCHFSRGTEVVFSPLYKDILALVVDQRWLIDGLLARTYRVVPRPEIDNKPWIGVKFKQPESVSSFEIDWELYYDTLPDKDILFKIEVASDDDDSYREVPIENKTIDRVGSIIKVVCKTKPVQTRKFRIVFHEQNKVLLSPCELKAFK